MRAGDARALLRSALGGCRGPQAVALRVPACV